MEMKFHPPQGDNPNEVLEKYSIDLTQRAKLGKLDPVIGRDSEIRRVAQVLSRRTKNNPVLIGEPGTGKTAVVEGLAQRIASSDVPSTLKNKKLLSLDLPAMVAGAKFRGEFEERLKGVLEAIKNSEGEIITFIDELHTVVGTGGDGSMDAGNMLKPMLARGELRMIGATTLDEYRLYIEKDPALERRFQQIYVGEPSVEDTIAILRGLKQRYEAHHKIDISDDALVTAAKLSNRYIQGRKLPDKAIDLIDEAASRLRMELDSSPTKIDQLQRTVDRLKMERYQIEKSKTPEDRETVKVLSDRILKKENKLSGLKDRWEKEKAEHNKIGNLKALIDSLQVKAQIAQRENNLEEASKILYGQIPKLNKEVDELSRQEIDNQDKRMVAEKVRSDEVAEIISAWTGIPVGKLLDTESGKFLNMESIIHMRLIGQNKAIELVSDAIRRSMAGLNDLHQPLGVFLFLGPTGVGKTELAKSLSEFLFDDEKAMLRIDMSEYSEKHSVARLIGSPPGYVGYEDGGQLTEAVRRRPYQVILLDEIEKANYEIFNILLQIFDDGRLTDGQGRTVDFKNTIIIMTSNLSDKDLNNVFKPEFINRIDDIVIFDSLSIDVIGKIAELNIKKLQNRLDEKKIIIVVDNSAKEWISHRGYDPIYGARPLKRLIQKEIVDKLAKLIISGNLKANSTIKVCQPDSNADDLKLVVEQ
jgi:ATP-dependent Clp protease ATP-binding subunit ClpB